MEIDYNEISLFTTPLGEAVQQEKTQIILGGRMGESWYTHSNGDSLFEIPKPLVTKGIGVDSLPDEIRLSTIFTGNDLAMLGNVEILPEANYLADEQIHIKAKDLLKEGDVAGAWQSLMK